MPNSISTCNSPMLTNWPSPSVYVVPGPIHANFNMTRVNFIYPGANPKSMIM